MNYKRPFTIDLLAWFHSLLVFSAFFPLYAGLSSLKDDEFRKVAFVGILLIIPISISGLFLLKIKNIFIYALTGCITCFLTARAAMLLIGAGNSQATPCAIFILLFSAIIFGFRTRTKILYGRMKKDFYEHYPDAGEFTVHHNEMPNFLNHPSPYHWIWFTVLYILGILLHYKSSLYILFTMTAADIIICYAYQYTHSLYTFIRQNQKVANLPLKTMRQIHKLTGILGFLLLMLFMLPSILVGHEFLPDLTIRKPESGFNEVMRETQQASDPEISENQIAQALQANETVPLWIRKTIEILFYALVALILFAIAVKLFRNIKSSGKDFASEDTDEIIFLNSENGTSLKRILKPKKHEENFSVNHQIRKIYRKKIQLGTKGTPSASATPAELEQNAGLPENEATLTLHNTYETARYSKDGCTKEDLKNLK